MELHPEYIIALCRELRKSATSGESLIWQCIRNRRLAGFKFRRQHAIGRYIADFYCREARLIIEIDGSSHHSIEKAECDRVRDEWIAGGGYRILRFSNEDALKRTEGVLLTIVEALETICPHPYPSPSGRGEKANIEKVKIGSVAK